MLRLGSARGRAVSRLTESEDGRGSTRHRSTVGTRSSLGSQLLPSEGSAAALRDVVADGSELGEAGGSEVGRSNALQAALNIVAEVMGAGILSLPYACAKLGWVAGLGTVVGFGGCACYSGLLVARTKNELCPAVESFADLAYDLVGPRFGLFTRVAVLLNWALLLPYFVIACVSALRCAFPAARVSFGQQALAVCVGLLPPLQLRTLHQISYAAGLSTAAMLIAAAIVLVSLLLDFVATPRAVQGSVWPPPTTTVLEASGSLCAIIFAYQGQSVYLEIMREMAEPSRFARSVVGATSLMTGTYALIVLLAYGTRGAAVAGFLPDDLADGGAKTAVGLLLALHTAVCYLVTGQPFHRGMHALLFPSGLDATTAAGSLQWLLITGATLAAAATLAVSVPFFPQVQALLGALAGAPIVFGWPCLFFLRASARAGVRVPWAHRLACGVSLGLVLPATFGLGAASGAFEIYEKLANSTSRG